MPRSDGEEYSEESFHREQGVMFGIQSQNAVRRKAS